MSVEKEPASNYTTNQMLALLLERTVGEHGGAFGIGKKDNDEWVVSAEYGREAPGSPMAGAATYGLDKDLRGALRTAGRDAGLWTEEDLGEPNLRPRRILLCETAEEDHLTTSDYPLSVVVQGNFSLLADADECFAFHGDKAVVVKHRDRLPEDVHVAIQRRSTLDDGADLQKLLDLILNKMGAATNQDLAADGPVGDEEGKVWGEIEAAANEMKEARA